MAVEVWFIGGVHGVVDPQMARPVSMCRLAAAHWHGTPNQAQPPSVKTAAERTLGSVVLIGCGIAVLAVLLLSAAVFDRRARARGHQLRDAGSWNAVRETRRDIKAGQTQSFLNSDRSWTAAHRRDVDADAQRRLEDGG